MVGRQIAFTVYGNAVPKARPRVAMRGQHPTIYTPMKTREWESLIKLVAQGKVEKLIEGPIALTLEFYLPRPKSLPKKIQHHTKRPDLTNLEKAIEDGLNGVVYKDDSQIVSKHSVKYYDAGQPRVEVKVKELLIQQVSLTEVREQ
jgi:Holliday junction resolvase RusA-like endonuclease